jgi:hypothetical protein
MHLFGYRKAPVENIEMGKDLIEIVLGVKLSPILGKITTLEGIPEFSIRLQKSMSDTRLSR